MPGGYITLLMAKPVPIWRVKHIEIKYLSAKFDYTHTVFTLHVTLHYTIFVFLLAILSMKCMPKYGLLPVCFPDSPTRYVSLFRGILQSAKCLPWLDGKSSLPKLHAGVWQLWSSSLSGLSWATGEVKKWRNQRRPFDGSNGSLWWLLLICIWAIYNDLSRGHPKR